MFLNVENNGIVSKEFPFYVEMNSVLNVKGKWGRIISQVAELLKGITLILEFLGHGNCDSETKMLI